MKLMSKESYEFDPLVRNQLKWISISVLSYFLPNISLGKGINSSIQI